MAQNHRVRISHKYKGDLGIIEQQIEEAIKRGLKQYEEKQSINKSEFAQNRVSIERRIKQFFLNCSAQFRNSVEFCKNTGKEVVKVVMQPDTNLQKINDVKASMLRQVTLYQKLQKFPQIDIPIEVDLPEKVSIKHCDEYQEQIEDLETKFTNSLAGFPAKIKKMKSLEKVVINNAKRLQQQQKIDRLEVQQL